MTNKFYKEQNGIFPQINYLQKGNYSNCIKEKHVRLYLNVVIQVNFVSTGTN